MSKPPDKQYEEGGWGWIVMVSAFTADVITFGNLKAMGVLLEPIARDFDTDLWLAGWVVSMSLALQFVTAPLIVALLRHFECRPVFLVGGVMATSGYLLAAVSQQFGAWCVFVAIFAGVGSGCFRYAQLSLLSTYFKYRYPFVLGIVTLGMFCGTMLYGPITQFLVDTYGWRSAMLVLGAITFHLVPCAAVSRPSSYLTRTACYQTIQNEDCVEDDTKELRGHSDEVERTSLCQKILETFNMDVFSNVRFILTTVSGSLSAFCFVGWAVYVVPHGVVQGLSNIQASFLPTAFGLGSIFGNTTIPLVLQTKFFRGRTRLTMSLAALSSMVLFFLDPFVTSFPGLLLVTVGLGIGTALFIVTKLMLYREIFSDGELLGAYCWQACAGGVVQILSGFVSGWFYEVTGSFKATFIAFGVVKLLSVVPLAADFAVTSYYKTDLNKTAR